MEEPKVPGGDLPRKSGSDMKEAPDVLKGVNLQVPKEKIFAIVGGNGYRKIHYP